MKQIIVAFLAALQIFLLCSCAAVDSPAVTAATETEYAEETTFSQETIPTETEITEPVLDEPPTPVLSVSSITFSLVGESEDIYLGWIPREEVLWEVDNPTIATFQNGILTAVGVGTTTAHAVCGDRKVSCAVSCLAETQEDLLCLSMDILRSPKRLPPELDMTQTCTTFEESAIIGDSISHGMFQWESIHDYLGGVTFLVRGGVSLMGFDLDIKNIYYKGAEVAPEDALADCGAKKAYFMLGLNDLGFRTIEDTMADWGRLIQRVREKNPDIEIYLQSNVPQRDADTPEKPQNAKIDQYNIEMQAFCKENNCHYISIEPYIEDHLNQMSLLYSLDNSHLNEAGCYVWMQLLRFYAQLELEGEYHS